MTSGGASRGERDECDRLAVERVARGDVSAIAELYDRYAPTAYGLAMKIVRDEAEAEDIVHDAYVALAQRAHQYRPERGTVAAWLVTTVRNLALDRARARVRHAEIEDVELRHEGSDEPRTPETEVDLSAERARIRDALVALPAAQRRTLELAFFEGLSYSEIGAREEVPLGTIKSRAARALMALRAAFGSSGTD